MEKYLYGKRTAEVSNAAGVRGCILRSFVEGELSVFRVYHEDGEFTDYLLRHDDLMVTIDADELASLYKIGDDYILDHSPQVLGLERIDKDE